jgi:hypothetical protein
VLKHQAKKMKECLLGATQFSHKKEHKDKQELHTLVAEAAEGARKGCKKKACEQGNNKTKEQTEEF